MPPFFFLFYQNLAKNNFSFIFFLCVRTRRLMINVKFLTCFFKMLRWVSNIQRFVVFFYLFSPLFLPNILVIFILQSSSKESICIISFSIAYIVTTPACQCLCCFLVLYWLVEFLWCSFLSSRRLSLRDLICFSCLLRLFHEHFCLSLFGTFYSIFHLLTTIRSGVAKLLFSEHDSLFCGLFLWCGQCRKYQADVWSISFCILDPLFQSSCPWLSCIL